jgi:hypothetical protein
MESTSRTEKLIELPAPGEDLTSEAAEQAQGGLIGLLLPAAQRVRETAVRTENVDQVESLALNFTKIE